MINNAAFSQQSNLGETFGRSDTLVEQTKQTKAPAKKVHGTNLVNQNDGRKPRLTNDFTKKQKALSLDLPALDQGLKEALSKLQIAKESIKVTQKSQNKQAAQDKGQLTILRDVIGERNQESLQMMGIIRKLVSDKYELAQCLKFKDFQSQAKRPQP